MPDIEDGESVEMKGSAAKPYILKNVGGVYSCSCPAWRNQSVAIEKRTCKHLRKHRGDEAEAERIGGDLPAKPKSAAKNDGPPLLLAHNWDNAEDLADWWMSEKLDGVRAFWNGEKFLSRLGNEFHAPDWFVEGLPKTALDGELWIDRKKFQRTVSVVRRQDKSEHWREVRYLVFDAPRCPGDFEERMRFLTDSLPGNAHEFASIHNHQRCEGLKHLQTELSRVESLGGEGLMLREPGSAYEVGRSRTLLKVKTFHDAEAVVVDHQPGKGKHKGKLGALVVHLEDGTQFSVGTGFSDAERASPPAIGSSITFRYQEFSDGGVPRFPSFVGTRKSGGKAATSQSKSVPAASSKKIVSKQSTKKKAKPQGQTEDSDDSSGSSVRFFEFVEGKSSKFWEITSNGTEVTVRYGRLGNDGAAKTKTFDDTDAAEKHASKLIEQKVAKGYVEKQSGS